MKKSARLTPAELRQYALLGATQELQKLFTMFPELQAQRLDNGLPRKRGRPPKARAGPVGTRTCVICGRDYIPNPKHATRQKTCGRKPCRKELSNQLQRKYREQRQKEATS